MSIHQFDREKFKAVIHYIVAATRPDELGRVKLHKVLYFSDMLWFIETGAPMTGAVYRKQPYGPCAARLKEALVDLESEGRVHEAIEWYHGYEKVRYASLQPGHFSLLNDSERDLLDETIDFVCRNNTAKEISNLSHTSAWDMVSMGDVMPYYSALNILPREIDEDDVAWATQEAGKIEAQGQRGESLQRRSYREFREELRGDPGPMASGD